MIEYESLFKWHHDMNSMDWEKNLLKTPKSKRQCETLWKPAYSLKITQSMIYRISDPTKQVIFETT